MRNLIFLILVSNFQLVYFQIIHQDKPRIVDYVQNLGYPIEDHTITTEDGYILTMYRIPYSKNNSSNLKRDAVLIGHGLFNSAFDWIIKGETSMPILLSNNGYDVWLINNRGTRYSQNHTTLETNKFSSKYWDFSFHEIGLYDYSASIDYVINKTGQPKIYYMGYSQGGGAMFVLLSQRPEYNKKLRLVSTLAPAATLPHNRSPLLLSAELLYFVIDLARKILKYNVAIYHTPEMTQLAEKFCSDGAPLQKLCPQLLYIIAGYSPYQMNKTLLPAIYSSFPEAGSTKQILHYAQGAISGRFCQYDYGVKNWEKYKSLKPPAYDLKKVTSPVEIYHGPNDVVVTVKDSRKLAADLPNLIGIHLVDHKYFNHLDFMHGIDAHTLIYQHILNTMKSY